MYTKQFLSAAAAVAVVSTGVMAFDMKPFSSTDNAAIILTNVKTDVNATYVGGVEADANLSLSPIRQGDTLIYPAFRSGDGWVSEISVRNVQNVSVVAKAVLYAKNDSRELVDFNLYLSPHDVAKFTIEGSTVTSTDGSIPYAVTPPASGAKNDNVEFASAEKPFTASFDETVDAGYVIVYGMAEVNASNAGVYHEKHVNLFKDYRNLLDVCRDVDRNVSNNAATATTAAVITWRDVFDIGGLAQNGAAADGNVSAPNVESNCTTALWATQFTGDYKIDANFTAPSADAMFGEVRISHAGDKRDMILPATALANYTTDNQMMLWAEGEYASLQDRRIADDIDANVGTANENGYADYNISGIVADSKAFVVTNGFFTFDKDANKGENDYAFLLLQPTKRAMVMAGKGTDHWYGTINAKADEWGYFKLTKSLYNEDEGPTATVGLIPAITSPLNAAAATPYKDELTTLSYDQMVEDGADMFVNGETAGYIDIKITNIKGLPAIVTEMSSTDVDGEAQINWIYSATNAK